MEKRVVVTGLGAVTPLGNDVKTTWENMKKGVLGIDTVTKFDATGYKCTFAGEVRGFDPTLYMPKGEVRKTDLYCQYAVAAATQAYEDSGLAEGSVAPDRFGVYIGSGIGGIGTLVTEHTKLIEKGPGRISPFFVPMMISNIASGTVAIKYHAQGPNIGIVTACATSTNSIGEAYRAIKHGYADVMLAGGSEAAITPLCFAGFISCQALSQATDKTRASIPFDKERAGFTMGEGGAVVMLEEYEHAKARGAKIYAEVVGYGCTNDAYHMTAPDPEATASARAVELAAKEGGIEAGRDVYVNAHGTGTPLNDRHPPQRHNGNAHAQQGGRRRRLQAARLLHQVDDRAHARRGGRRRGDRLRPRPVRGRRAAHHQLPRQRRGLRPRHHPQRSGRRPPRGGAVHLARVRRA